MSSEGQGAARSGSLPAGVTSAVGEGNRVFFMPWEGLEQLISHLVATGYEVIGPKLADEAITYQPVNSAADLPRGWTDVQGPGSYRLEPRTDGAVFGYVVGPHSWKRELFPPLLPLTEADGGEEGWTFREVEHSPRRLALLGVRACELAAMRVQDRVFLTGAYVDPVYRQRRSDSLVIAVNCTQAAATCFCDSMDTGPRCTGGYDLCLTELTGGSPAAGTEGSPTPHPGFVVEAASPDGAQLVQQLGLTEATVDQRRVAAARREQALGMIQRRLETEGLRDLLLNSLEHPHWDRVAERCLSCANCTMVCPTCFCSSVVEVSDLAGTHVERQRQWDSCFNVDFSYMNGGNVRDQIRPRYRQWLTHKLASWVDQFGSSGCVGCGRCITWCPVGIDLTEEVRAIRGERPEPGEGATT